VSAFIEKPPAGSAPTNLINAGIYVMEPAALNDVERGRRVSVEREVFPALVELGALYAFAVDGYWIDIGNPAAYVQANLDIAGNAVIDPGAKVDPSAVITDSVVLDGALIGPHAVVDHAIIGAGANVGARASVREFAVVGPGATVADGAEVVGGTVE
jgi:mannose-1-phosphate guanylyltransferase